MWSLRWKLIINPEQSYPGRTALQGTGLSSPGPQTVSGSASMPYQSGSYQGGHSSAKRKSTGANPHYLQAQRLLLIQHQISGPYQERMSAEELSSPCRKAESFRQMEA